MKNVKIGDLVKYKLKLSPSMTHLAGIVYKVVAVDRNMVVTEYTTANGSIAKAYFAKSVLVKS